MKVSRVAEMREMDRKAIEFAGIPETVLMENAGLSIYQALAERYPVRGKHYIVFCGSGNNGGDGLVVARKIHSNVGTVTIYLPGDPQKFGGAARLNYDIAQKIPLDIRQVENMDAVREEIHHCDGIIDALFGTGLERPVGGIYQEIIQAINASSKPVISVDIPSGVNGNTGEVMGIAVRADLTVTFGLPKLGCLLYPGYQLCGKLLVSHISFPPSLYDDSQMKISINDTPALPSRRADGHKGDFGQALFIAGAAGYYGAPSLSALSFLKAGGGYSRLAAPASVIPVIAAQAAEIVFLPQAETSTGSLALACKESLLQTANKLDFSVLGPGISLNNETIELARGLAAEIEKPLLIDGDGITAVCTDLEIIRKRNAPTILTPHLGEMSRITGIPVEQIRHAAVDVLQHTTAELNAIIVLKGAHTLIGLPDGKVFINLSGNSGMGTAGSGDVLTGTIAAMYGLGLPLPDAVRKGVYIHGLAGDLAAAAIGEDGITAHTILDYLPQAVQRDRSGLPPALQEQHTIGVVL